MRLFKREPKPLYPVHLHSLGYLGSKREPLTWFRCPECGYRTVMSSTEEVTEVCQGRWSGSHDPTALEVADPVVALRATAEALDNDPDLIARSDDPR